MYYSHNQNISISFYNDKVKEIAAEGDFVNPFTFVPIKAAHMEVVSGKSGNAIVFGNITEGYDPTIINIDIETTYSSIASDAASIPIQVDEVITSQATFAPDTNPYNQYYTEIHRVYVIGIPYVVRENAFYFISVQGLGTVSYQALAGDTAIDVRNALDTELNTTFGAGTSVPGPNIRGLYIFGATITKWGTEWFPPPTPSNDEIFTLDISAYVLDFGLTIKYPILKYGSTHDFGIVYKDKMGRRGSVLKDKSLSLYLPFYCEHPDVLLDTIAAVTFKINHLPPSWAESYEIVYAGNVSMDYFLQIQINDIKDIGGNRFAINIQDTLNWTREHNMRWKVPDYVWQDGDRIRLIGTLPATGGGAGEAVEYTALPGHVYDYEIEEQSTEYGDEIGGDWLVIQAELRPADFDGEHDILAEIYRPRKGLGTTWYYGTGMAFEIGVDENGYRYHKGDIDQILSSAGTVVVPANVYNTANDCWKYQRITYVYQDTALWTFWAESIAPSDWWRDQAKLTSQGWPFLWDISQRQVTLGERLRHGGYLLEGTRINNIAWFTYEKFVDLPQRYGDVTGLREIAYTLKVLQLYKESSIYLQRIQTFSADGGLSDYSVIDNLLGTVRPLESDYGCQHPDSILVSDRNLYYWDNSEGKYIRSAPNGQIAISDNKMRRWFKDLTTWIKSQNGAEKLLVNSGANIEHNEIWVNWNIEGVVWGAIFSETHGRWISRIDQKTESYVHLGQWFAHMYRQKLYIMNDDEGQAWLEWAGVPTVGDVQFASSVNPLKNKVFNSLAVYADHQMNCNSRFITIPNDASYELMETYVAVWNESEGIYYGRILKDQNSPGNFASANARTMNGREMRGRYCLVRLRTEEHDEKVRIFSVMVISTDSERSS